MKYYFFNLWQKINFKNVYQLFMELYQRILYSHNYNIYLIENEKECF